ncbi:MAG: hypothetical protein IT464_05090 [Planctomycetes bacterium]|nr:hypothetical protein [Planctomycetota bacterium]
MLGISEFVVGAIALAVGAAIGAGAALALRKPALPPTAPGVDLDAVREQQAQTLAQLKARIVDVQAQRDKARAERERLMQGLNEIGAKADSGVTIALTSAKELAEKARELGAHESAVSAHDDELNELQGELQAAEELLSEVDTQREALKRQVQDQSKELFKLRMEIEASHHKSNIQRARTMMLTRSSVRKTEVVANRLEDQLKHWVKKSGECNVNWSEHGHASTVAEAFSKLDREFIDRYFSHATNTEYERGQHRVIRVHQAKSPDGEEYGELVIALDDDAGRTLTLRFELRKDAPDARFVGFVLAMYLRALTRDFREFGIIVR